MALAENPEGAVAAVEAEVANIRLARLAHPQPVQAEQDSKGSALAAELLGGEQEPTEFSAVHPVALARMHRWAPHVLGWVRADPPVDMCEPIEADTVASRRSIVEAASARCSM